MIEIERSKDVAEALLAMPFLTDLDRFYPDIQHWYINRVLPGVCTGHDVLLLARDGHRLCGMAIGKTGEETKLRCVRVNRKLAGQGTGVRLIDRMIIELQCENPSATVAEELLHDYSRIFVRRYGWRLSDVVKNEYRRSKLEYHWNTDI